MNHALAFLLVSTMGIDVGWQPTRDGGFEYIIQIEPELLESLVAGQEIISDIPPFLRGVRSYRIRVGTEPLPQEGVPPEIEPVPSASPPLGPAAAANQPTPAGTDRSFNERIAPEKPTDAVPGFNEAIAPEPLSEDDIPDNRSGVRNGSPPLLDEETGDAADEKTLGDRYANRGNRYGDLSGEDLLESAGDERDNELDDGLDDAGTDLRISDTAAEDALESRPALAPPTRGGPETSRPDPFLADAGTKPLINHAGYRDEDDTSGPSGTARESGSLFDRAQSRGQTEAGRVSDGATRSASTAKRSEKPAEKPWAPFTLAMLGLFASMGGNCYLGWLGWGFRERYLRLLDERKFMRGRKSVRQDEDADVEAVPEDYDG